VGNPEAIRSIINRVEFINCCIHFSIIQMFWLKSGTIFSLHKWRRIRDYG
jgi:hypothetical protein